MTRRSRFDHIVPQEPSDFQSPATKKPTPYVHYEGHDLRLADMDTIWSVGATPKDAIEALCKARWKGRIEGVLTLLEGGDPAFTWGYRFVSDEGTIFKAAGIHVPGGVICTWWK